jgi:hypothetical protein
LAHEESVVPIDRDRRRADLNRERHVRNDRRKRR